MKGIWLSKEEIAALPVVGDAWDTVKRAADKDPGDTNLIKQDSGNNVAILAKALVYARTGQTVYLTPVVSALRDIATGTLEKGARALALGRELCAYVLAADLIDLGAYDAALDAQFCAKLRYLLTAETTGGPKNLEECHEKRPNNWGTHAGASRIAIALYLGDQAKVARAAQVFKGWLGDRASYAGFEYGGPDNDLSWQVDPANPVGILPIGATIAGHDMNGAQPEELRRTGTFRWPIPHTVTYPWEGLQGAVVQAQLLARAGYPAWEWCDKALLRAVQFLYTINWPAAGDDVWQVWLINAAYDADFPALPTAGPGKNLGWTAWTHATKGTPPPPPPTDCADCLAQLAAMTDKLATLHTKVEELHAFVLSQQGD